MTHAELLRSHANLAIKEGGMFYNGEYLSGIATVAESLEAENSKLRELVRQLWSMAYWYVPDLNELDEVKDRMRELGIEVD